MGAVPFPAEVQERVTSYIKHQGTKSPEAIVDLVRVSQQKYLDLISGLSDETVAKKPAADEWSIRELTRHVLSAQTGVTALVHNLARGEAPPKGGGAGQLVDDNGGPFALYVDQLRALNGRMLETIADLPAEPNLEAKAPHPFFGPLNCKEWAAFQRIHDEDHAQHAQKILAVVGT